MARGEFQRVFLWSIWVTNLLVNACFVLICWATADNLARMSGNLEAASGGWSDAEKAARAFVANSIWRAPIAACAVSGLMATLFNVTSCLVLVRKSMTTGPAGFMYGFVTAWALVLAFTTLLCGLVLEAFKSTVRDHVDPTTATATAAAAADALLPDASGGGAAAAPALVPLTNLGAKGWTRAMTGAYAASYGFAYACTMLYALFFLALLVFQKAIAKQLGGGGAGGLSAEQQQQRLELEISGAAAAGMGLQGGLYSQANAI